MLSKPPRPARPRPRLARIRTRANFPVYTLANAGPLDGSVGVAALGRLKGGLDSTQTAAALANASTFGELQATRPEGERYLVAQQAAFNEAADKAGREDVLRVVRDIGAAWVGLAGVDAHVSGADWRINVYPALGLFAALCLCAGLLYPHRHGPGGVIAWAGGRGSRRKQRADAMRRFVVQLCFVAADRDDRTLVLQRTGPDGFTLDVQLPPGLSEHAMGDLGTGRLYIASADGGGCLLHGQSRRGLADSGGGSVAALRQVIVEADNEPAAVRKALIAVHLAAKQLRERGQLGPLPDDLGTALREVPSDAAAPAPAAVPAAPGARLLPWRMSSLSWLRHMLARHPQLLHALRGADAGFIVYHGELCEALQALQLIGLAEGTLGADAAGEFAAGGALAAAARNFWERCDEGVRQRVRACAASYPALQRRLDKSARAAAREAREVDKLLADELGFEPAVRYRVGQAAVQVALLAAALELLPAGADAGGVGEAKHRAQQAAHIAALYRAGGGRGDRDAIHRAAGLIAVLQRAAQAAAAELEARLPQTALLAAMRAHGQDMECLEDGGIAAAFGDDSSSDSNHSIGAVFAAARAAAVEAATAGAEALEPAVAEAAATALVGVAVAQATQADADLRAYQRVRAIDTLLDTIGDDDLRALHALFRSARALASQEARLSLGLKAGLVPAAAMVLARERNLAAAIKLQLEWQLEWARQGGAASQEARLVLGLKAGLVPAAAMVLARERNLAAALELQLEAQLEWARQGGAASQEARLALGLKAGLVPQAALLLARERNLAAALELQLEAQLEWARLWAPRGGAASQEARLALGLKAGLVPQAALLLLQSGDLVAALELQLKAQLEWAREGAASREWGQEWAPRAGAAAQAAQVANGIRMGPASAEARALAAVDADAAKQQQQRDQRAYGAAGARARGLAHGEFDWSGEATRQAVADAVAELGGLGTPECKPLPLFRLLASKLDPAPTWLQVKNHLSYILGKAQLEAGEEMPRGVTPSRDNRFRVTFTRGRRHVHVGMFGDKYAGARAWDCVAIATRGRGTLVNFVASDYSRDDVAAARALLNDPKSEDRLAALVARFERPVAAAAAVVVPGQQQQQQQGGSRKRKFDSV